MPLIQVSNDLGRQNTYGMLTSSICYAAGCDRTRAKRKNGIFNSRYCSIHSARRHRLGVTWAPVRKMNARGLGCISRGYHITVKNGKHYQTHRLVWEAANGPIPAGYVIHHKNRNRADNKLENLQCLTQAEHLRLHKGMVIECL